jgi:hypothetical protein
MTQNSAKVRLLDRVAAVKINRNASALAGGSWRRGMMRLLFTLQSAIDCRFFFSERLGNVEMTDE